MVDTKLLHICTVAALAVLCVILPSDLECQVPTITVSLMPSEPADESRVPQDVSLDREIEDFCRQYPHVTILNTSDPYLRTQLVVWSPEFALAAWPMLKGQRHTLEALEGFAKQHNVHVNFRLESWARALSDLGDKKSPPDVAQVGSTWIATLAAAGLLKPSPSDGLEWRPVAGIARASLPYTTDLRLIFYWRRPLGSSPTVPLFNPTSGSWPSFLKSLEEYVEATGSKPIAFPIGLSQNLLHDYAGLVWAGGGGILSMGKWRTYINLTDKKSLAVPLLLASSAVVTRGAQPYRLLAFPEMDHEEATRHFMAGDYLAVIEPVAFIRRWFDNFAQRDPKPLTPQQRVVRQREFWDYAGVGILPRTFKGGSDLVVPSSTRVLHLAFSLASFLTHDKGSTELMGRIGWLPAQLSDHGLGVLKTSLWNCERSVEPCQNPPAGLVDFIRMVQSGLENGREYPQYANWPMAFESREALDELQNLWRAMGHADENEIRAAAAAAEVSINRQIDWWTRCKERARQVILFILLAGIPVAWLELSRRKRIATAEGERAKAEAERARADKQHAEGEMKQAQELRRLAEEKVRASEKAAQDERDKGVALRLLLAEDHMRLHSYVMALQLLGRKTEDGERLRDALRLHCEHVSYYGKLATELIIVLCKHLESEYATWDMGEIASQATKGAMAEFDAAFPTRLRPNVALAGGPALQGWEISALPALLVLIFWEWFFNCLKEIPAGTANPHEIGVEVHESERGVSEVTIVSPTLIPVPIALLFEQESSGEEHIKRGIPLIRELLRLGFKAHARCKPVSSEGKTYLTIMGLPLRRRTVV